MIIYAGSQVASTYFMSTTMDKTQRILFMVLPLGFVFFILSGSVVFPAGLLLYWVTTNLWTVGQGLITRRLVPRTRRAPQQKARSARRGRRPAARERPRRSPRPQPRKPPPPHPRRRAA